MQNSQNSHNDTSDNMNFEPILDEQDENNIETMIDDIKESKLQLTFIDENDAQKLKELNDLIRMKEQLLYQTMVEEGLITPQNNDMEFDTISEEYLDYYEFKNNQNYSNTFKNAQKLLKKGKKN